MLKTSDLHIGYGRHVVQSNLNLHAKTRDLICLTGTNGCGKSTLLRTLAGLQKPLQGEITIQGKSVHKLTNFERSTFFSLVLTDAIDTENLTIHDLVALGRFPYTNWAGSLSDIDEAKIAEALQQVNLTHKTHAYLTEISDGEKQRAIIAKALAQDTPLVLLDEPTAHLDLPNRVEIMLLLRRLSVNTQKTFILSTHELDLALQMADKIWLMKPQGIEVGIPEDLMLTGKFQEAFGSHAFQFDENDGHFKINHLVGPLHVNVIGEKPATLWLQRALIRCGIQLSESAPTTIEAKHGSFHLHDKEVNSIEEVLKTLMN
ncbi:MAG TPA: ABC transporter ATP-binding protein [Paludibacteraceae bacterium]|nr:ABC transporter ATP-binding protein [Paludibacteraceae bacterium]HQB69671.1 ABC transporter ATP-binding protein [Paludibacteraceae bacterium]HRS67637.1 ABC transporter ATP-binding protein [Paludibacteraceae bacterium]